MFKRQDRVVATVSLCDINTMTIVDRGEVGRVLGFEKLTGEIRARFAGREVLIDAEHANANLTVLPPGMRTQFAERLL